MPDIPRVLGAALPILAVLLLLIAVFRNPWAGAFAPKVGAVLATPVLLLSLWPRLTLGEGATPADTMAYFVVLGVGLTLLVRRFGRTDLE